MSKKSKRGVLGGSSADKAAQAKLRAQTHDLEVAVRENLERTLPDRHLRTHIPETQPNVDTAIANYPVFSQGDIIGLPSDSERDEELGIRYAYVVRMYWPEDGTISILRVGHLNDQTLTPGEHPKPSGEPPVFRTTELLHIEDYMYEVKRPTDKGKGAVLIPTVMAASGLGLW